MTNMHLAVTSVGLALRSQRLLHEHPRDWLAKCLKESLHEQRKCTHVQMTRQTLRSFGEEWDAKDARLPHLYIIV
ncbi:hypothetical protein CFP56_019605 [Quercus suber]|uniref:Uncharacterized protein n=1 Tax=Quercus suber TaxID=58331 RepID=A0AAW0KI93_QUESU